MTVATSIQEMARRFLVEEWPGLRPGLIPFALQRFMQGRSFQVPLSRGEDQRFCEIVILKWAFAWNQKNDPRQMIPPRFSPPVAGPGSELGQFCKKCWCGEDTDVATLQPHLLFENEQKRLRDQADRVNNIWTRQTCLVQAAGMDARWLWAGKFEGINGECGQSHDLYALAEIELTLLEPSPTGNTLGDSEPEKIALLLHANTQSVLAVFGGDGDGLSAPIDTPVFVKLTVPALVRLDQSGRAKPTAELAKRENEARAVDRFLQRCRQVARRPDKFEPLAVLLIRRCGDDRNTPGRVRGRFAFGYEHWGLIQVPDSSDFLSVAKKLEMRIFRWIDSQLTDQEPIASRKQVQHGKIVSGLRKLGFTRPDQEKSTGDKTIRFDSLVAPERNTLEKAVKKALLKPFPVDSVVSNRIMAACVAEQVNDLWESDELIATLAKYPRETLLSEMAVLPSSVAKSLFYVPLPVPVSRHRPLAPVSQFLSYAVAMCPVPDMESESGIHPEDFREAALACNDDIYMAFIEQAYRQLRSVCSSLKRCRREFVAPRAGKMRKSFEDAMREGNQTLLEFLRLGDFYPDADDVVPKQGPRVWQTARPRLLANSPGIELVHKPHLELLSAVLDLMYQVIEEPIKFRQHLVGRDLQTVLHSGLVDDLAPVISRLETLPTTCSRPELTANLFDCADILRLIQRRWTICARRFQGHLSSPDWKDVDRDACSAILSSASTTLRRMCEREKAPIPYPKIAPDLSADGLDSHTLYEEPAALTEIFIQLLSNLVRHEQGPNRDRPKNLAFPTRWGLSVSWLDQACLREKYPRLSHASSRWKSSFQRTGVALISAFPCSMKRTDLDRNLDHLFLRAERPHQGLWVLATLTAAYHQDFRRPNQEIASHDAIAPLDVEENGNIGRMLVLVPAK